MKTGEILKSRLGLSHLKYVYISRVIGTAYRTSIIFYDSRRPNVPITTHRALKGDHTAGLFLYPFQKEPTYLPLIPLDDYAGPLHPAMFFVVDLSGEYGKSRNKVDLKRESTEKKLRPHYFGSFKEFVTFNDLNSPSVISAVTQRSRTERNRELSPENMLAKLVDINIDTVEDHVTFVFKTPATTPVYPDDYDYRKTDVNNFELENNPGKTYELYLRVLNFLEWLKGTKPDAEKITAQDVKDVLKVNNVQVFSTSPSFHWQGFNFWMSQLDGSIYPTDIRPTRWDNIHGDGQAFLDKHLYGLIRGISFHTNYMASTLNKKLKDRGLI